MACGLRRGPYSKSSPAFGIIARTFSCEGVYMHGAGILSETFDSVDRCALSPDSRDRVRWHATRSSLWTHPYPPCDFKGSPLAPNFCTTPASTLNWLTAPSPDVTSAYCHPGTRACRAANRRLHSGPRAGRGVSIRRWNYD